MKPLLKSVFKSSSLTSIALKKFSIKFGFSEICLYTFVYRPSFELDHDVPSTSFSLPMKSSRSIFDCFFSALNCSYAVPTRTASSMWASKTLASLVTITLLIFASSVLGNKAVKLVHSATTLLIIIGFIVSLRIPLRSLMVQ